MFAFTNLRERMTQSTPSASENAFCIHPLVHDEAGRDEDLTLHNTHFSLYGSGCKKGSSFSSYLTFTSFRYQWPFPSTARPVHADKALRLIPLDHFALATWSVSKKRKYFNIVWATACQDPVCTESPRSACLISRPDPLWYCCAALKRAVWGRAMRILHHACLPSLWGSLPELCCSHTHAWRCMLLIITHWLDFLAWLWTPSLLGMGWLLDPGWSRLLSPDLPSSPGLATTMGPCWQGYCPSGMVPPSAPAPLPSQSSLLLTHSSAVVFCKPPIGIGLVYRPASPQELCPLESHAGIRGVRPLFYLDRVSPLNAQHWEDRIAGFCVM